MLHICRHYLPDIVYLYLSHEMLETHKKDNRYMDTIERLGKLLNHSFEVHIIERDDLINVQQYDIFYQDFRDEIQKIEKTMDSSDKLLINMASGTPAMKSALFVMATLAEYRFQPIQVSTPGRERNKAYDIYPIKGSDKQKIFEYALVLNKKLAEIMEIENKARNMAAHQIV